MSPLPPLDMAALTQTYVEHPDAEYDFQGEFFKTCFCGMKITIFTQRDDNPEYYYGINVVCASCGKFVEFTLPVN